MNKMRLPNILTKVSLYKKIFKAYRRGDEFCRCLPSHLWIEPTNCCNLKCTICPSHHSERKKGYMSFSNFQKILDQTVNRPVVYLHMAGEPLLHPDIFRMIRYAAEKGASPGFFTNATRLNPETANLLMKSEPDWLGFSFDGYTRNVYEQIRKNADFDSTLGNIEYFLRLKHRLKKTKPHTYLSLVEPPELAEAAPLHQKKAFRKYLHRLGLNQFETVAPHLWAGKTELQSSPKNNGSAKPPTRCPAPWSGLGILWDGRVVACCLDIEGEYVVGDITKNRLEEIWNGVPMRRLRRMFASGDICGNSLCRACHIPHDTSFFGVPGKVWTELSDIVKTGLSHLR